MPGSGDVFNAVRTCATGTLQATLRHFEASPLVLNGLGQTLLFFAVQNQTDAVGLCRSLSEDYRVDLEQIDRHGQTALFYLAKTGHVDCLAYLVSRRCNINLPDRIRQTPIFYAASSGMREMVKALVSHNADVNFQDKNGETPLFYASTREVLHSLLNSGASRLVRNGAGKRLSDYMCDSPPPTPKDLEYFRSAASLQRVHRHLAWSYGDEGSLYTVLPAAIVDVSCLCSLENAFIEDHCELLRPLLPNAADDELSSEVGVHPEPDKRRSIVQSIVMQQTRRDLGARDLTLKCVRLQPGRGADKGPSMVVGYLYFKLRGPPSTVVFSHLKVCRLHQGRGCATLLMAGALRWIAGLAEPVFSRLQLSVIEQNAQARALYTGLGFREVGRRSGPVVWVTMARDGHAEPLILAREWLSRVPGGVCSCVSVGPQDDAAPNHEPVSLALSALSASPALMAASAPPAKRTRIRRTQGHRCQPPPT